MGIVLHGGEPMLFDPDTLRSWLSEAADITQGRVLWTIQTNATLVTDEWIQVIADHSLRCSVSLDGTPESHDRSRVTHSGTGSYDAAIRGFRRLVDAGRDPGLLCVIDPTMNGREVYRHFRSLGARRFNFLIPDVSRDAKAVRYGQATGLSEFLISAFDEWFDEDDPDVYVHLFREVIRMLHGASSRTDALGNLIENYLVVDTNGDILANDALKVCFEGAAESGMNVRTHALDAFQEARPTFRRVMLEGVPLCQACRKCPEREICGGGAVPNRYSRLNGFDNPSAWCDDLFAFIGHVRSRIEPVIGELAIASL